MTSNDASQQNGPLGALADRMGMTVVEASADRVVITMPVAGNTQPYGLLHGGASAVLVETAGSIGAAMHAGPASIVVGLDISVTHHRGVTDGVVTATAEPLSLGRTVTSYEVRVADESGRPVCTGRLTCLVRPAPGGEPKG
jgi:1,4-dihydroxy-2-naphthoyl-CoA hydrolase